MSVITPLNSPTPALDNEARAGAGDTALDAVQARIKAMAEASQKTAEAEAEYAENRQRHVQALDKAVRTAAAEEVSVENSGQAQQQITPDSFGRFGAIDSGGSGSFADVYSNKGRAMRYSGQSSGFHRSY